MDAFMEGVDRSPQQMIAYQLGWMNLIREWDADELAGKEVVTPAPGYKWNQMGLLYKGFYEKYKEWALAELQEAINNAVGNLIQWLKCFTE